MTHFFTLINLALTNYRYGATKLRGLAVDTLRGPPPASAADWAQLPAPRELASEYAQTLRRPPYFAGPVLLALLSAIVLFVASGLLLWSVVDLEAFGLSDLVARMVAVGLATLGVVALWAALAKDHGPHMITAQSHALSQQRLELSLDHQVHHATLLLSLALLAVVVADGVMAGTSILGYFKSQFTATMAMTLSVLWGVIVGAAVWKLTDLAADEARIVEVRRLAREIDASTEPVDRTRLAALMSLVGPRIGISLAHRAQYVRRLVLIVGVVLLAIISGAMRSITPPAGGDSEPSAAQAQWVAKLSDADEITLPPPSTPAKPGSTGPTAPAGPAIGDGAVGALLPSLMLSMVLLLSAAVLYWHKARSTHINVKDSARDAAVLARFPDAASVVHFNDAHFRKVVAALDRKLQRFSREIEKRKTALAPSAQRQWPPCQLRAIDLLRKDWFEAHVAPTTTHLPEA